MLEQLQMIWPPGRTLTGAARQAPAGYVVREFRDGDKQAYIDLMRAGGFDDWNDNNLAAVLKAAVPDGIVFAEHIATNRLAATAMGWRRPTKSFPDGYEMGWVAAEPAHRGKGLGQLVVTAVTRALLRHGARQIFLLTDDWRLPAIKSYLNVGYAPLYRSRDVQRRWNEVFCNLNLNMAEFPGVECTSDG